MSSETRIQENKKILKSFLEIRSIPQEYQVKTITGDPFAKPYGYIYCIENKNNHKKYIGSVYSRWNGVKNPSIDVPLRKRASNYIYDYHAGREKKVLIKRIIRPITSAIINEGIENFVMYPIAETTKDTHNKAELFFIKMHNTLNIGYNVLNNGGASNLRGINRSLTAHEKKIRSEGIISINIDKKLIIRSESMKLFGDYMNTTKDMIKNTVRKGRSYKGWYSFYLDPEKRRNILINNVINDQDKYKKELHSEKAKEFYKELYNNVEKLLGNHIYDSNEYFPNFTVLEPLIYKD